MIRNLKVLGLALIAVFAVGAMAASAASAVEFTAESYPVTLTGTVDPETKDSITTTSGSWTCPTPAYHGVITGPTTTVTVTASYGDNCTAFGLLPTIIDMNSCDYLFHAVAGSAVGTTDVVCTAPGDEITVTVNQTTAKTLTGKCTIHIPPQTGINGITYTDIGAGTTREITVDIASNNIKYTHTAGTGLGACAGGSAVNGTFSGKELLTGERVPPLTGHVGIFTS